MTGDSGLYFKEQRGALRVLQLEFRRANQAGPAGGHPRTRRKGARTGTSGQPPAGEHLLFICDAEMSPQG